MVTTAPSPVTEWVGPRRRSRTSRIPRPERLLGHAGRLAPLAGDSAAALLALVIVPPLGGAAGFALAATWVALLAPTRAPVPRGAPGLTGGAEQVGRAGLVLAFVGLLLGELLGAPAGSGGLAAYVALVVAATLGLRATLVAVDRRTAPTDVVLAGHRHGVARLLGELRTSDSGFRVVAVCVTGPRHPETDLPAVVGLHHLPSVVAEHAAAAVIAAPCRHLGPTELRRLGWQLEQRGTPLFVGTGLRELGPARARLGSAGSLPLIHVRHAPLRGPRRVVKGAWERAAAAAALLVLAPLLAGLALLVRLDSPGPALFRQTRVGRDGRTFTMLKLRTMSRDAEARRAALSSQTDPAGLLFKVHADPRVTRVGRFLRRYSLDELPQLVNVVRGEMALVGPRPSLPCEADRYDDDTRRRLAVTPGLTGLWQVSGRSDLSWEESVRLDLRYVENWSIGLDLAIILRTAQAVIGHRGAY